MDRFEVSPCDETDREDALIHNTKITIILSRTQRVRRRDQGAIANSRSTIPTRIGRFRTRKRSSRNSAKRMTS